MFEITGSEYNSLILSLRSQFVTSNQRGGRRYMPFAFTEHGVIMLACLLRSDLAVQASIRIIKISPPDRDTPRQKIGFKIGGGDKI